MLTFFSKDLRFVDSVSVAVFGLGTSHCFPGFPLAEPTHKRVCNFIHHKMREIKSTFFKKRSNDTPEEQEFFI